MSRCFITAGLVLLAVPVLCSAQQEYEITIQTTLGDTTETFWLQIPQGYRPSVPCPLLIGWHQLGADHREMKRATDLDSIANARTWIAASHRGSTTTNWANHPTQSHVVDVIHWIENGFNVDPQRIYMVGASMGGAAGMVFCDNHLDPDGPMIAAAASVSGIQDCERRYHEQGINQSMIEAFGGTPDEVPYEYHRNSAICFADSNESMHFNARHLPLFLTFGSGTSDLVWRQHAEDLYPILAAFADTVTIRESSRAGHGWVCAETAMICDFLGSFVLERFPAHISINADEEGRWYWSKIRMREPAESFAHFEGVVDVGGRHLDFTMYRNVQSAVLDLASVGFPLDQAGFTCRWDVRDDGVAQLTFTDVAEGPSAVLRDGRLYTRWTYDPVRQALTLDGENDGLYTMLFGPASSPAGEEPAGVGGPLRVLGSPGGGVVFELRAAGPLSWGLFDPLGRKVGGEDLGWRGAGSDRLRIPEDLPSGTYFFRMRLGGRTPSRASGKLTVVR